MVSKLKTVIVNILMHPPWIKEKSNFLLQILCATLWKGFLVTSHVDLGSLTGHSNAIIARFKNDYFVHMSRKSRNRF